MVILTFLKKKSSTLVGRWVYTHTHTPKLFHAPQAAFWPVSLLAKLWEVKKHEDIK